MWQKQEMRAFVLKKEEKETNFWIKINRKSQTQALFNSLASLSIKIYLKIVDSKAN